MHSREDGPGSCGGVLGAAPPNVGKWETRSEVHAKTPGGAGSGNWCVPRWTSRRITALAAARRDRRAGEGNVDYLKRGRLGLDERAEDVHDHIRRCGRLNHEVVDPVRRLEDPWVGNLRRL